MQLFAHGKMRPSEFKRIEKKARILTEPAAIRQQRQFRSFNEVISKKLN